MSLLIPFCPACWLDTSRVDERLTPQMLVGTALVVGSVAAVWRFNSRPAQNNRSALADQA